MILVKILIFVFGLCLGSFLNVLIYRLPLSLSLGGRSFCPHCRKKISWFDNLPLLSFFILKGRCRACRSPISFRYPLVELTTGILFVLGTSSHLSNLGNLSYLEIAQVGLTLILFSSLIAIFFIDLEHQIIPDEVLLPVISLFLLSKIFASPFNTKYLILNTFLPAAGASLFLFLIWALTKGRGMGLGDVKLAFLMGLSLGYPRIVVAFYIAFLTGAFSGVILILGKKAKFGQKIAFGPFLAWATIVSYLWGEKILSIAGKLLF